MLGSPKLPVLSGCGQFSQHILIEIALHIKIRNIMFIKIIQSRDDFLKHLGRGYQKHGIAHITGKGRIALFIASCPFRSICDFTLLRKVRQASMLHILDSGKYPLRNDVINITGITVFKFAPTHGLPRRRLWKDLIHLFAGHIFKFFALQLLFIQRPDEHKISQLFNDCQGICDTARPDIRPDLIHFIFDCARYHVFSSIFALYPNCLHSEVQFRLKLLRKMYIFRICQNAKGNLTSSPTEKADSPDISVTLKLAPSHPLILIIPFILPSSDVNVSSPFPLSTKVPCVPPCL